jgi:hypothetical protein
MGEKMRILLVAALCMACLLIIAGLPAFGYNSLNETAEAALSLSIPAKDGVQTDLDAELGDNYSAYLENIPQDSIENDTSIQDAVDSRRPCENQLWIVDYWGHHYPCNGKCVFVNDVVRMIVIPCKRGILKLHEEYIEDGNFVESRPMPVSANKKYNWYFIGDMEGTHRLWFTLTDRLGQVSQSNEVRFKVLIENCSPVANCSPVR